MKYILIFLVVVVAVMLFFVFWGNDTTTTPSDKSVTITPVVTEPTDEENEVRDLSEPLYGGEADTTKKSEYYVTTDDCENSCADFENNTAAGRYCKELCGIIPIKEQATDCSSKERLSRDYCFRDRAITEKNTALCDNIRDRSLSAQCHTRVAEHIIDGL